MPSNIKYIKILKYFSSNNNNNNIYLGAVLVGRFTPEQHYKVNLVKEEACTPNHLATSP